jgi:hypothetical protein
VPAAFGSAAKVTVLNVFAMCYSFIFLFITINQVQLQEQLLHLQQLL